jgi:hypothetical protein
MNDIIITEREKLLEKINELAKKSKERRIKSEAQEKNRVIKLPYCKESERTIPNIIARSALFGVIKRGTRPYKNQELIASRDDIKIYYTGKTLDQADCTVWMQALAYVSTLGQKTPVNRAGFLKLLGKTTGKKDYLWLDASLHRLMTGVVTVRSRKYELEFHLIDSWGKFRDENNPVEYLLSISPDVVKMWFNSEYTRVEWDKRLAIKQGGDLASWMQLYIRSNAVSKKSTNISLNNLKQWCGRNKSEKRKFRSAMKKALIELTRIGEIRDASIRKSDDMVIFTRISEYNLVKEYNRDSNAPVRDDTITDRDSLPGDRDSLPGDRDSLPGDRDSLPEDRDSLPEDRDSLPDGDRDSKAGADRDSKALDRDSKTKNRDSKALDRDSRTKWYLKLLKNKKFFRLNLF